MFSPLFIRGGAFVTSVEINAICIVIHIVDGDTVDYAETGRIRLADINAPELGRLGRVEARNALRDLVLNEKVYLDVNIDDRGLRDKHGRVTTPYTIATSGVQPI